MKWDNTITTFDFIAAIAIVALAIVLAAVV